jgi:hypothetical protein
MERGGWGLPPTRAAGRESPSTPSNPHPGSTGHESQLWGRPGQAHGPLGPTMPGPWPPGADHARPMAPWGQPCQAHGPAYVGPWPMAPEPWLGLYGPWVEAYGPGSEQFRVV